MKGLLPHVSDVSKTQMEGKDSRNCTKTRWNDLQTMVTQPRCLISKMLLGDRGDRLSRVLKRGVWFLLKEQVKDVESNPHILCMLPSYFRHTNMLPTNVLFLFEMPVVGNN